MNTIKLIGSILALVGGSVLIIHLIIYFSVFTSLTLENVSFLIINLVLSGLAICGGVLALIRKKIFGGVLVLISGAFMIVFGISIFFVIPSEASLILPFFSPILDLGEEFSVLFVGIKLEALLTICGGVLILVSRSD